MEEIKLEDLKVIQMDILSALDKFLRENKIRYSLACGSLLGAARHKGYIPWDDDIDIYMPRKDYDQLLRIFPDIYDNRYKIASLERDSLWDYPYAKVYDSSTILFESGSSCLLGVNVDIFPIDDVPDKHEEWVKYNKRRRFLQYLYRLRFVKLSKNRSVWKNSLIVLNRIITSLWSRRKLAQIIDKYAQKYNDYGYTKCFENVQGMLQKHSFEKKLFDELVLLKFENREFLAFKDYDSYLTAGFGDWRKLPPEEKQVSHHVFKAYWKPKV